MHYHSLNNKHYKVTFRESVEQGLAPDSGLFFPDTITPLPDSFFDTIENRTNEDIAYEVIHQFTGEEITETGLREILSETLCFDFPLVKMEENIFALELFHGPTLAFKDVGARFMSRCLAYFNKGTNKKITVLVATSGDTGGAVANGFLGVENTNVVILYPDSMVSDFQERQLTTLGQNIKAIAVKGTFDDCQAMVKKAFLDNDLKECHLTSANSINIARWLPQMFYFFFMYKELKKLNKPIILSCPSGNFGNICAGMMAKRLGLPIEHFIASTNSNDTIPRFMTSGTYEPKTTVATISNAMDVSNPSNFVRIVNLYNNDLVKLKNDFSSYTFTDTATSIAMQEVFQKQKYCLDPHGAVGYLGLKKKCKEKPNSIGVFLETAHPIKFEETVKAIIGVDISIPVEIKGILNHEKVKQYCENYNDVKHILLEFKI
ncbi:threonine synthase [Flavobacterium sp. GCM10023249]|uniref:threonine synthase n=1 Tax=unclassified Flavobacterium TaxID=196869 RepID=UPI0036089D39